MTICSHTIVKNGMPFIEPVINQISGFVDTIRITASVKSDWDTLCALERLSHKYGSKLILDYEDVTLPSELTLVRQAQLDKTKEDWVFFVDADDYWPISSLRRMKALLDLKEDVDAYSFRPFQVVDSQNFDKSWGGKWFTKLYKNQPGVHYEGLWPRDLIYKGDDILYWKRNSRVLCVPTVPFFHLSNIMGWRFRDESWANEFRAHVGSLRKYPDEYREEVDNIFNIKL